MSKHDSSTSTGNQHRGPTRLLAHALLAIAIGGMIAVTSGCSGSSVQGPDEIPSEPDSPAVSLSFAPIAGDWVGMATANAGVSFAIETTLSESAREGEQVGTVAYAETFDPNNPNSDGHPECEGIWKAESVDGRTYSVTESINSGPCPDGIVSLVHDPQAGILEYEFDGPGTNADAEGVLRRDDS